MSQPMIDVYLEIGGKRAIASAVGWPGWARGARDEAGALQALLEYAPRYARVAKRARLDFAIPADVSAFNVVERLPGNAYTDYGVPVLPFPDDGRPVSEDELAFYQALLRVGWAVMDEAATAATGRELRKGPRGGGRELEAIQRHVAEAEKGYLKQIGQKTAKFDTGDVTALQTVVRQAVLDGLASAVRDGVDPVGPRGGRRWTPREFVRRVAWHTLDHAWEIEDRVK